MGRNFGKLLLKFVVDLSWLLASSSFLLDSTSDSLLRCRSSVLSATSLLSFLLDEKMIKTITVARELTAMMKMVLRFLWLSIMGAIFSEKVCRLET